MKLISASIEGAQGIEERSEGIMIPEEKTAAVSRALREAFGAAEPDEIHEMNESVANPVFRIVVRGSPYLLRINARAGDVARHYACMHAAAEAGVAPRVWYTNAVDRISITDFVHAAAFPADEALIRVPPVLRTLHSLPLFAGVPHQINTSIMFLIHKGPALDGFLQKFQAMNILPKSVSEELFARYAQLAAVYPDPDTDLVSSHNDLFKPDNMLFDGQRLWLVDWEAAFRNDRYADLAVVANQIVANETEERTFLGKYFGAPPTEYQRARLYLAQQVAHIFYTMGFLFMSSSGTPIDWSAPAPPYSDFQRRFWSREIELKDREMKIAFARTHCERLLHDGLQPRFEEALRIVSEGGASAK